MVKTKRLRGSVGQCIYCGQTAKLTPDHVPPKNLFLPPRPSNLITVPSCTTCNGGASKDDEYFKNVIVLRNDVGTHREATQLLQEVLASLKRPAQQWFTQAFLKKMSPVSLVSPSGLYLGRTMAMDIEGERVKRVLNRTIRGLFYHERKERLPTDCLVNTWIDMELPDPRIMALLLAEQPKVIGNAVFSYRAIFTKDEKYGSAWLLVLYDAVRIVSLTMPLSRTR